MVLDARILILRGSFRVLDAFQSLLGSFFFLIPISSFHLYLHPFSWALTLTIVLTYPYRGTSAYVMSCLHGPFLQVMLFLTTELYNSIEGTYVSLPELIVDGSLIGEKFLW